MVAMNSSSDVSWLSQWDLMLLILFRHGHYSVYYSMIIMTISFVSIFWNGHNYVNCMVAGQINICTVIGNLQSSVSSKLVYTQIKKRVVFALAYH